MLWKRVSLLLQTISRMSLRSNILLKTILSWKYSVLKIKLRELSIEILGFPVFCCPLRFLRSSNVSMRYHKYTRFFVKDNFSLPCWIEILTLFMSARSFFSKSFFEYFQKDKEQYFNIDVIYHCCSFLDPCNNDFDFLFFEECNNPNHLYIFFSKKMVKTFKKKKKHQKNSWFNIVLYFDNRDWNFKQS